MENWTGKEGQLKLENFWISYRKLFSALYSTRYIVELSYIAEMANQSERYCLHNSILDLFVWLAEMERPGKKLRDEDLNEVTVSQSICQPNQADTCTHTHTSTNAHAHLPLIIT